MQSHTLITLSVAPAQEEGEGNRGGKRGGGRGEGGGGGGKRRGRGGGGDEGEERNGGEREMKGGSVCIISLFIYCVTLSQCCFIL